MTNIGDFCLVQLIYVTFALTEDHTFHIGAECDLRCYGPLHGEDRDRIALLSTFLWFSEYEL